MTDWTRLESRPNHTNEELRLTRVSGNVSEFENRSGCRYRCVTEGGVTQWFGSATNKLMKRATRAGIQICCRKLERNISWWLVSGFFQKSSASAPNFRAKLTSVRGVARKFSFRNRRKEKVEFRPGKPGIECGQDTTTTRLAPDAQQRSFESDSRVMLAITWHLTYLPRTRSIWNPKACR